MNEEQITKFDYDEDLVPIVENALAEGYQIQETIWVDEWEREEGEPSICEIVDPEEIYKDGILNLPSTDDYTRGACAEWNFVKDDEYICFFHTEHACEYLCKEAVETFGHDNDIDITDSL